MKRKKGEVSIVNSLALDNSDDRLYMTKNRFKSFVSY